ncbi:hypothetical protein TWF281_007855 [Arthrobotrys megalospora]
MSGNVSELSASLQRVTEAKELPTQNIYAPQPRQIATPPRLSREGQNNSFTPPQTPKDNPLDCGPGETIVYGSTERFLPDGEPPFQETSSDDGSSSTGSSTIKPIRRVQTQDRSVKDLFNDQFSTSSTSTLQRPDSRSYLPSKQPSSTTPASPSAYKSKIYEMRYTHREQFPHAQARGVKLGENGLPESCEMMKLGFSVKAINELDKICGNEVKEGVIRCADYTATLEADIASAKEYSERQHNNLSNKAEALSKLFAEMQELYPKLLHSEGERFKIKEELRVAQVRLQIHQKEAQENERLRQQQTKDLEATRRQHDEYVARLRETQQEELNDLRQAHEEHVDALGKKYARDLSCTWQSEVKGLKSDFNTERLGHTVTSAVILVLMSLLLNFFLSQISDLKQSWGAFEDFIQETYAHTTFSADRSKGFYQR